LGPAPAPRRHLEADHLHHQPAHRPRAGRALMPLPIAATAPSVLDPAGPAARELAGLGWPILVFFTVAALAMWCLLAWVALRRRGSLDRHERYNAGGGEGWIVVGGFVIPAISFAAVFVMTLNSMAAFPMTHDSGHGRPDIRLTGRQWWWEVEYLMDGAAGEAT